MKEDEILDKVYKISKFFGGSTLLMMVFVVFASINQVNNGFILLIGKFIFILFFIEFVISPFILFILLISRFFYRIFNRYFFISIFLNVVLILIGLYIQGHIFDNFMA